MLKGGNRTTLSGSCGTTSAAPSVNSTSVPAALDPQRCHGAPPARPARGGRGGGHGRVAERVSSVMGIARVCRAVRVPKDPAAAIDAAVALAAGRSGSFAVRARRRDKRFPLTSAALAREIGSARPAGLRLPGQPLPSRPDHRRRGGPAGSVRPHQRRPGPGRAAGRDERPRAGAHVRRDRLPGRRVPDDAPRAALRLPALLRDAADRPRIGVQGVRADATSWTASRTIRGCTWSRSARPSGGWRPRVRTGSRSWRSAG